MTDEKMIEEMAKDIFESKVAIDGTDMLFGLFDEDDHYHRMARFLYKHNYRKLPKNAVVLTKEEHKQWLKDCIESNKVVEERIRRETATEILKALKTKQVICSPEEDNFVYMLDINELAKQYGVEVEE